MFYKVYMVMNIHYILSVKGIYIYVIYLVTTLIECPCQKCPLRKVIQWHSTGD